MGKLRQLKIKLIVFCTLRYLSSGASATATAAAAAACLAADVVVFDDDDDDDDDACAAAFDPPFTGVVSVAGFDNDGDVDV